MELDFGGGYTLRRALAEDHPAINFITLKTGDSGRDATAREDDPDLLGLIYSVPYQVLEPDFAFVVEGSNGVCGYILGTRDTAAFYERAGREWFPPLASRLTDPGPDESRWRGSDWARRAIHHPEFIYPEVLHAWPAHGHIDLLEEARGRGIGSRGMRHLMAKFREASAQGMHLHVSPKNHDAQAFYRTLGFKVVRHVSLPRHTVFMATTL